MPFQQSGCPTELNQNLVQLGKLNFSLLLPSCWLVTHWQQKDDSVISRQFVPLSIKTGPSQPCMSKAASFPVAPLFLHPAATHCYCHICPPARGIAGLASPEATVNASFLLCWLGMHLASSVSDLSSLFFRQTPST